MFAVLKHCLSQEHDLLESTTGESISKSNFLTIYGCAHLCALTSETIVAAFCKMGIWPFNRNMIMKAAMAPSKETSCEAHLPAPVAPEIQELVKPLCDLSIDDGANVEEMQRIHGNKHHESDSGEEGDVEHYDTTDGDATEDEVRAVAEEMTSTAGQNVLEIRIIGASASRWGMCSVWQCQVLV
jgi:hypothetical protein